MKRNTAVPEVCPIVSMTGTYLRNIQNKDSYEKPLLCFN